MIKCKTCGKEKKKEDVFFRFTFVKKHIEIYEYSEVYCHIHASELVKDINNFKNFISIEVINWY